LRGRLIHIDTAGVVLTEIVWEWLNIIKGKTEDSEYGNLLAHIKIQKSR
jgi:hypothetical protein